MKLAQTFPQHRAQVADVGSHRGQHGPLPALQLQKPPGLTVGGWLARGKATLTPSFPLPFFQATPKAHRDLSLKMPFSVGKPHTGFGRSAFKNQLAGSHPPSVKWQRHHSSPDFINLGEDGGGELLF